MGLNSFTVATMTTQLQQFFSNLNNIFSTTTPAVVANVKNNKYPFFNCLHQENLNDITCLAQSLRGRYKRFIVVGFGGSINAAMTYAALAKYPISFVDSIDPVKIAAIFDNVKDIATTAVIFISKSGCSDEILHLYKIFAHQFASVKSDFVVITQFNNNPLHKLALENDNRLLQHASDISGRFSYLSIVALLVAAICQLDIKKIHEGAQDSIHHYLNLANAQTTTYCNYLAASMLDKYINANVFMVYHDALLPFQVWWQQLWAESLGKNGLGSIPVAFSGTRDQHSQLQLYLAQPAGKTYTMINFTDYDSCYTELTQRYKQHAIAVHNSLVKTGAVVRQIIIPRLDEYNLAYLMTMMVIEVVTIAELMAINAFNQDMVEAVKQSEVLC